MDVSLIVPASATPSFSYTDGQTLFTESLSWTILKNIEALEANGFKMQFSTSSEVTGMLDDVDDWSDDLATWLDSVFATSGVIDGETRDLPAPLPSLPSSIPYLGSVLAYLPMLIKVIELVLKVWERKKEYDSDTDMSDMMEVFHRAFLDADSTSLLQQLSDKLSNMTLEVDTEGRPFVRIFMDTTVV